MDMIGKIRRLHMPGQEVGARDRAHDGAVAQHGVEVAARRRLPRQPKYRREARPNKLTPFHEALKLALKADARPAEARAAHGTALFAEIKAAGYDGGYSRVTDFIRAWRQGEGQAVDDHRVRAADLRAGRGVPVRLERGRPGRRRHLLPHAGVAHEAVREPGVLAGGVPEPGSRDAVRCAHAQSFAALGGVARRGIYDNMKTAVDKVKKGKGRIVNARFAVMCAHYLFDPDFCNVASGWEKGVVEKNVQDSRRRIWIEAGKRRFGSLRRTQCLAGGAMPSAVGRGAASRAQPVQRGRDARARAAAPDADARAVRRLRREAGAGVEHLPGVGGAQPLLGAVRAGRPDGQHAAVSGRRRGGRRRCGRRRATSA